MFQSIFDQVISSKVAVSQFYVQRETYRHVVRACVEAAPYEAIGVLWAEPGGMVVAHQPLPNFASQNRNEARVPSAVFEAACNAPPQRGLQVHGIYHSHVGAPAILSRTDKVLFERVDALWVISLRGRSVRDVAGFRRTQQGAVVYCPVVPVVPVVPAECADG